ncbi:hypothetical protein NX02_03520 [Sphingomonas sanxanigenens DSM 19645 = NX02]|uniref:Uncharacterized protein n=1 Tax=Sphingomonas sanxanigenens DSM 19645 = NX02 TaxID=1123269 RepID=W0A7Z3_9SPHN|nr:hypothetical protein NX02_03520 [Sphingomonas sanxanigenens DSM 19645 = NX02]
MLLLFILGSMLAVQDTKTDADVFGKYLATNLTARPA